MRARDPRLRLLDYLSNSPRLTLAIHYDPLSYSVAKTVELLPQVRATELRDPTLVLKSEYVVLLEQSPITTRAAEDFKKRLEAGYSKVKCFFTPFAPAWLARAIENAPNDLRYPLPVLCLYHARR